MAGTRPRDPYEVLGIARDADDAQIKKAFRRLARELHPDVNKHDPDAEEKFKEAAEAYEILNDPERRATYDRYGHDGLRSGGFAPNFEGFGSISDLFDAFFGSAFGASARSGPAQGGDVAVSAEVTLAEAATGGEVELSFEAVDTCERCHGNGAEPGTPIVTCDRCGGAGVLQAVTRSPFGQVVRQVACDARDGDDLVSVLDVPAPLAALGARLPVPSLDGEVDVELAPGTQPGAILTVAGKGMPRLRRPERHGDLRVVVNVIVPRKLSKEQRRLAQELADSMTAENLRVDESLLGKLKRLLG